MTGRGQGRSRKDKRHIDHEDSATPSLPSTPHLHSSTDDGRQQSSRHTSFPPHPCTHQINYRSPSQQYSYHFSPQGYTPLPPYNPAYSYMGIPSQQSQGHVVIRPSSALFASPPTESHPSRLQPPGSQQGSGSQQWFGLQQWSRSYPSSSATLSPSPRSSSPSISRLHLRDSSAEPDASPSTHTSDTPEDHDRNAVRYDRYHRMIIRPEGNGFIPNHQTTNIITEALDRLYDAPYATWSDFSPELVE
nr:putative protein TPRXL isoform X2 [Nicotiana tomentosiformis]